MGFNLTGEDDSEMAEINVTPLVDVMLVLLIIFMIAAPMLHQGIEVNLPKTEDADVIEMQVDDPLVLSVKPDGMVYIKDDPVHSSLLLERLEAVLASRDDNQVYLRGDQDLNYGEFIHIVDLLRKGGIHNIGLVTEQAP